MHTTHHTRRAVSMTTKPGQQTVYKQGPRHHCRRRQAGPSLYEPALRSLMERCRPPPFLRRVAAPPAAAPVSDRLFEFLGGAEGDLLARLDLDRLAGRGIASHARRALAHLEDAERWNA